MVNPICINCGKEPSELSEYVDAVQGENEDSILHFVDANDYVRREEGTYNRENGHFFCTPCYIKVGMPLGKAP